MIIMEIEESSAGIVVNNGKVVLAYQTINPSWSFPKGHVDKDETPLETAKREVYEETGIKDLNFVKKLGTYVREVKGRSDIKKRMIIFLFTTKQDKIKPIDQDNPECKWFKINDVPDKLLYEEDKNFFLKIKDEINKIKKQN